MPLHISSAELWDQREEIFPPEHQKHSSEVEGILNKEIEKYYQRQRHNKKLTQTKGKDSTKCIDLTTKTQPKAKNQTKANTGNTNLTFDW